MLAMTITDLICCSWKNSFLFTSLLLNHLHIFSIFTDLIIKKSRKFSPTITHRISETNSSFHVK